MNSDVLKLNSNSAHIELHYSHSYLFSSLLFVGLFPSLCVTVCVTVLINRVVLFSSSLASSEFEAILFFHFLVNRSLLSSPLCFLLWASPFRILCCRRCFQFCLYVPSVSRMSSLKQRVFTCRFLPWRVCFCTVLVYPNPPPTHRPEFTEWKLTVQCVSVNFPLYYKQWQRVFNPNNRVKTYASVWFLC